MEYNCANSNATPSKLSYAQKLADHYDMNLNNMASPGSSALSQFNRFHFINNTIHHGDIVIFLWPYSIRSCIYNNLDISTLDTKMTDDEHLYGNIECTISCDVNLNHITNHGPNELYFDSSEYMAVFQSDLHDILSLMIYMNCAQHICKNKGIKLVQNILDCNDIKNMNKLKNTENHITSPANELNYHKRSFLSYGKFERTRSRVKKFTGLHIDTVPDGHLNEDMHVLWANICKKAIDKL